MHTNVVRDNLILEGILEEDNACEIAVVGRLPSPTPFVFSPLVKARHSGTGDTNKRRKAIILLQIFRRGKGSPPKNTYRGIESVFLYCSMNFNDFSKFLKRFPMQNKRLQITNYGVKENGTRTDKKKDTILADAANAVELSLQTVRPTNVGMYFMFCGVFVLSVVLFLMYKDCKKPDGFPPGPPWKPIAGCLFEIKSLLKKVGFYYLVLEVLSQIYGPVVGLRLGRDRIVLVSKQEHVKKILLREEFDGRPDGFFFRMRSYHKRLGIVFVDGAHFQEQKRFCLTALKKLGMGRKVMEDIILKETEELVTSIEKRCQEDSVFQMNNIFDVSVLNSLWSLMTGKRFDLQDKKLCELTGLVHESFRLLDMSGGVLNQMPFLRFLAPNATGYNKIRFVLQRFENFLQKIVLEHEEGTGKDGNNMIDLFLMEMRSNKSNSTFTGEQLITLLLDLFMAGSETTSNSLVMAMLYMSIHPDIQTKVQASIDAVVPADRLPNLQDRPRLGYVEAVLLEVLRHGTVVPISVAHRSMSDVHYKGYVIPKDSIILVNLRSVLMDKEHWGDPDNFRPERFQDEDGQIIQDEWFFPFGLGKRRCLGEGLARSSMFLIFAGIMQNFQVLKTVNPPSLSHQDGVTLSPRPFEAKIVVRQKKLKNSNCH